MEMIAIAPTPMPASTPSSTSAAGSGSADPGKSRFSSHFKSAINDGNSDGSATEKNVSADSTEPRQADAEAGFDSEPDANTEPVADHGEQSSRNQPSVRNANELPQQVLVSNTEAPLAAQSVDVWKLSGWSDIFMMLANTEATNQTFQPVNQQNGNLFPQTPDPLLFDSQSLTIKLALDGRIADNALQQSNTSGQQADLLLRQIQQLVSNNNDQVQVTVSYQHPQQPQQATLLTIASSPINGLPAEESATTAAPASPAGVEYVPIARLESGAVPLNAEHTGSNMQRGHAAAANVDQFALTQNGKTQYKSDSSEQQNGQQHQASSQSHLSTAGQTQPAAESTPGADSPFVMQFHAASNGQTESVATTSHATVATHAGHVVQEDDVIQQIIQRFSLQTNIQTSKISLKLHPAELGELKIDVLVKHDTLKANIYAQTRQAQEIIEKHLPRLKAILEEQGLQVEDLLVSLQEDTENHGFNENNQPFSDLMNSFKYESRRHASGTFGKTFAEVSSTDSEPSSGVNLTV